MSTLIAAFPMYDWPEVRDEADHHWARLRDRLRAQGIAAPERLARRNADLPPVPGGIRDAAGQLIAPDPASLPPDELDLPTLWRHPDLLVAQTCWGPMELGLQNHVQVVGQPDYSAFEGGRGEFYSSAIVMRRSPMEAKIAGSKYSTLPPSGLPAISPTRGEIISGAPDDSSETSAMGGTADESLISPTVGEMAGRPEGGAKESQRFRHHIQALADGDILPLDLLGGKRLAFNSRDSMSGIIALGRDLEAMGSGLHIFAGRIETGSHRASVAAVAEGRADVCAVDCRSWQMIKHHQPETAAKVVVVGWTALRKGLPLIAASGIPSRVVSVLREALKEAGMLARAVEPNPFG